MIRAAEQMRAEEGVTEARGKGSGIRRVRLRGTGVVEVEWARRR